MTTMRLERGRLFIVAGVLASALLAGVIGTERSEASEGGGKVTVSLKSVWMRKYPMIVYLDGVKGEFTPPEQPPVLDQKNKMFIPHVLPVLRGATIRYVNHDDTKHNVYFIQPDGVKENLGTGMADWSRENRLDQPGVYVHRCNIHDEMWAFIPVFENPFFQLIEKRASSDPATVTFEDVAPGEYTVRVWCEKFYDQVDHKFNTPVAVTVNAGQISQVDIRP